MQGPLRPDARAGIGEWAPGWTAAALAAVAWAPEAHRLVPDGIAWTVHLAAIQACMAALCLMMAWRSWTALGCAVWFATQCADELTNGNVSRGQEWEYPLLLMLLVVGALMDKLRPRP